MDALDCVSNPKTTIVCNKNNDFSFEVNYWLTYGILHM